jgi:hypothetical protein
VKIPEPAAPAPEAGFPNIVVNPGTPSAGSAAPAVGAAPGATPQVSATQPATAPPRPRKKKSWFSTGGGDSVSSDVSLVASGVVGAIVTVVWLVAMIPLTNFQFGQLFLE